MKGTGYLAAEHFLIVPLMNHKQILVMLFCAKYVAHLPHWVLMMDVRATQVMNMHL